MDLTTARNLVLASSSNDWEPWDETFSSAETHGHKVTYVPDVALVLWWGRMIHDDFSEPWTDHFEDRRARSIYVEATYGGSLVLQDGFVIVDSGRYCLPLGRVEENPTGQPDEAEYHVSQEQLVLGRLLHAVGAASHDFDQGIVRAGFIVDG